MTNDHAEFAVNPWRSLPPAVPFVLACDATTVDQHNSKASEAHRFRLEMIPEPFLGNPDAPAVLLNLNPGFVESDLADYSPLQRQEIMRRNLLHGGDGIYYLLPEFDGTAGARWWRLKLGPLISAADRDRVRCGILVLEFVGYKSKRFRHPRPLASQPYTFSLLQRAIRRKATIIVMRGEKLWRSAVEDLAETTYHRLNSPQNVMISPKNCPGGWGPLIEALGGG